MTMKTRKSVLMLALTATAFGASLAASAAIVNPDNDSAAFFANRAAAATASVQPALLRAGDVSTDGLYVYSASDRGWEQRAHSFVFVAGELVHTTDCVPYNNPKPAVATVPGNRQLGAFGEHGA